LFKIVYNNTTGFSHPHSSEPHVFLIRTSAYRCTGWKALLYFLSALLSWIFKKSFR